jgi:hypothetical protein
VFFNRLGEMRDRSFENQRYRASGLTLVTAAIVLWNTVYLERAIQAIRDHGHPSPGLLAPPQLCGVAPARVLLRPRTRVQQINARGRSKVLTRAIAPKSVNENSSPYRLMPLLGIVASFRCLKVSSPKCTLLLTL